LAGTMLDRLEGGQKIVLVTSLSHSCSARLPSHVVGDKVADHRRLEISTR